MSDVVNLSEEREKRQPHASGKARCLDCKHEWVAVSPLDTYWLQCPGCSLMRGKYLFPFEFADQLHWTCACGNDLFYIMKDGCRCPNCGQTQAGF